MEKLNYFAIMPAKVRYDENLKPMEKLIYSEITVLTNFKGYCYATNSYFANLYEVHKKTVAHWISNLTNLGYLKVEMILKKGGKEVEERRIYILERRDKVEGVDDKNIDRDLVEREEKEFFEVENGKEKNKEKVEIIEEEIVEKKTPVANLELYRCQKNERIVDIAFLLSTVILIYLRYSRKPHPTSVGWGSSKI